MVVDQLLSGNFILPTWVCSDTMLWTSSKEDPCDIQAEVFLAWLLLELKTQNGKLLVFFCMAEAHYSSLRMISFFSPVLTGISGSEVSGSGSVGISGMVFW